MNHSHTATPTISARAAILTRRTYNRPKEDGSFESWDETVARVISHQEWLWERAQGRPLLPPQIAELDELSELMVSRRMSMSGRTLWLGGTDIAKRREASQFNPLKRSEEFITSRGVRSFEAFKDGDEAIVLTHLGKWKKARVAKAGVRNMKTLNLRRGRSTTSVETSVDHTWILADGTRATTEHLKVDDKVWSAPDQGFYDWRFDDAPEDEQAWWCYGFVFGDGAISKSGQSETSRVRLCGAKADHLTRFISCGFGFSFPPSCDRDPIVYTGGYLKTLPDEGAEPRMVKAFLRGYLDADGNKQDRRGTTVFTGMSISDNAAANFVREWAPAVGLYISREETVQRPTNYGLVDASEFSFTTAQGNQWRVEGIEDSAPAECWCLTVEGDHSFVLPSGVVSGNCSFTHAETVYDMVDILWLLLQGCGVGFKPIVGTLTGFARPIPEIEVIRSTRTGKGGTAENLEDWDPVAGEWTISIGDSAEAWAKSIGKILAGKFPAKKLVLDFSQIRPAGERLKGYGWISSGDADLARAYEAIAKILNRRAGSLLTRIDILDIVNWMGTVLSSRRSAQICVVDYGDEEWAEFATAKHDFWLHGNEHRQQSNNTLLFHTRPAKEELARIFELMIASGGSEPGFANAQQALKRAPWFKGFNPCAEILLGNKSFCNLTDIDVAKFRGQSHALRRAAYLAGRANYRQTCVNLLDGVLQESWHLNNEFLRLCGVGLTGIARRPDLGAYDYRELQRVATSAAMGMAEELGLPHPKNVTTVKPSGTLGKIMDTSEGSHKPLGRYIFNNVTFKKADELVEMLRTAGYKIQDKPFEMDSVLITLPVEYADVPFDDFHGTPVNLESAVVQLDRYKMLMDNWCQQNVSQTIYYGPEEKEQIVDWLHHNWDSYIGVSFIFRTDPTKTAKDLGYQYLPQEVVSKATYDAYCAGLKPVDFTGLNGFVELVESAECAGGSCPVR